MTKPKPPDQITRPGTVDVMVCFFCDRIYTWGMHERCPYCKRMRVQYPVRVSPELAGQANYGKPSIEGKVVTK